MVNASTPWDDARTVKLPIILVAASLASVACSGDTGREFARYYDPEGFFTTNLPAANTISVRPPGSDQQGGPQLLTGVIASPPQPSAAPSSGIVGSNLITEQASSDQTIYEAFAFTTSGFSDLDEMALTLLTGDPAIDVLVEDGVRIDGTAGRLLVADIRPPDGEPTATVAAGMTLGSGGTGYLVAAIFPPGGWESEREDFLSVVRSFRIEVPPGIRTFPVLPQAA